MAFVLREFQVNLNNKLILITIINNFNYLFLPGTSIGFKNIASKIAYDLRLWLKHYNNHHPNNCLIINKQQVNQSSSSKQSKDSSDTVEEDFNASDMIDDEDNDLCNGGADETDLIEISLDANEPLTPSNWIKNTF